MATVLAVLAQGASPQGRGLEPHSCHVARTWSPFLMEIKGNGKGRDLMGFIRENGRECHMGDQRNKQKQAKTNKRQHSRDCHGFGFPSQ